ncbi:MAG: aminotransferase class V-fold PLP-dependent enzyme [bacterium]
MEVAALRRQIVGIDRPVPLLDGSMKPYVYLDNAASAPALRPVQEKVNELLEWYSSVHRGSGYKSMLTTDAYERSRQIVASFCGADTARDCVIFVKNTTEAINKLAHRIPLQPGEVVLTTGMEHHSNDLPWRGRGRVEYVGLTPEGSLDLDDLAGKLQRLSGQVRLVAVTGASNVTGFINPLHEAAELAHQAGALFFADCAQLAPHRSVSMGESNSPGHLDFLALSGHKLYAPFGSGVLIGPQDFFQDGPPDMVGGGTIEIVSRDEVFWADAPQREEAGSPNVVGAVALAAAIQILQEVGMERIAAHEASLTRYALQRLAKVKGLRIYGSADPERLEDRVGVIAFNLEPIPHAKVAAILSFEGGIAVRDGCFCAHPYVIELLGVDRQVFDAFKERALHHDRSTLPGLVRASFGCFSNEEDVDRLVEMLERIEAGDYRGDYRCQTSSGSYFPVGVDLAAWLSSGSGL